MVKNVKNFFCLMVLIMSLSAIPFYIILRLLIPLCSVLSMQAFVPQILIGMISLRRRKMLATKCSSY
jgi:hypothetical protein